MTKARDLANFVSTGNPLADGTLSVADISDLTASAAELNVLDGITASTAELNILDGVTSSAAELNILDGVTASTAELNIVDGDTVAASVTLAGTDGFVLNDAGTTKLALVSDINTYIAGASATLTNKTLTDPAIIGTILEDIFTITDGAAFEIDPGNGSIQLITLGASRTPKATNFVNGEAVTLMVDDGSAYTLTWTDATFGGSGVVWKTDGGVAPTLNTTGYTVIVLWEVGGQVYGARVGDA